jgi:probable rRNA maturation factor
MGSDPVEARPAADGGEPTAIGTPTEANEPQTEAEMTASETDGAMTSVYMPPFRIDVTVRPGVVPPVSRHRIATAVKAALESAGAPGPASIGVILSADVELAELNAVHMGHEGPTDVLSFPFFPPEAYPAHERGIPADRDPWVAAALKQAFALPPGLRAHLGDLIVSVERAIEQASEGRGGQTGDLSWSPTQELVLLAVHGTLHICGWDHGEPVEEAAMRALEKSVLAGLPHDHEAHEPVPAPEN